MVTAKGFEEPKLLKTTSTKKHNKTNTLNIFWSKIVEYDLNKNIIIVPFFVPINIFV
jgi:hypothetical protein